LALNGVGVQPGLLAADQHQPRMVVQATREVFGALAAAGNTEIPRNLH
jgi:hypothetical protein